MKKLITTGALLLGAVAPLTAFAAYNDVTLGSSAVISVAAQSFNVEGDSNVVESITVEGDTFSFILQPNSTLKVSSPSFNQIESNALRKYVTDLACESNSSFIKHSSSADSNVSVTIIPKAGKCPIGGASGGSSAGNSSSGGGSVSPPINPVVQVTTSTINALVAQIAALQAQIAAMSGVPSPAVGITASNGTITSTLSSGSRGVAVRTLQQFLNSHGFQVASSGPGSPGQETDMMGNLTIKAVQKFQEKYGIAKSGESGYGTVGPKTRAKINELSGQ